ncbi:MAG: LamG-like jellyroll fold domain-containing protein, partial [Planctomycetota bacterium]
GGGSVKNLTGDPRFSRDLKRTSNSVLALNGRDQFVELQHDVAYMQDTTIKLDVTWRGGAGQRILEFAGPDGNALYMSPSEGGRFVFAIRAGGKTERMTASSLPYGKQVSVMVVLSGDKGRVFFDDKEVAKSSRMTLDPEDVGATVCFLGRGMDGNYFRGAIDNVAIHTIALVDDEPPTPNPASFSTVPTFFPPDRAVMQAVRGVDPLGGVEYRFEETTGTLPGMKSEWSKDPSFAATGLRMGRTYKFRVTMRDGSGNTTAPSESLSVTAKRTARVFVQSGGPEGLVVMEAENFHTNAASERHKWKLVKAKHGSSYSGSGAILADPDRGGNFNENVEATAPRTDYVVRFKKPGRYWIWVRAFGRNPNGDSVHVGVDMKLEKGGTHLWTGWNMYQWVRSHQPYNIRKPGIHVVNLWAREDGTTVDKLLITSQGGYQPSAKKNADRKPIGPGPAESARE